MKMKIEYDKEADALYIMLRDIPASDSRDLQEGATVDLDDDEHIVGLEILDASERLGLEALLNISIENIPLEKIPGYPSFRWSRYYKNIPFSRGNTISTQKPDIKLFYIEKDR